MKAMLVCVIGLLGAIFASPALSNSNMSASCRLLSSVVQAPEALGLSETEAAMIAENILASIGLRPNFRVLAVRSIDGIAIENAAAILLRQPNESGLGQPYIVYNPEWIARNIATDRWKAIAVLSHEIGHHLQQHTLTCQGSDHRKEIEADEFAGRVLRALGASLDDAQSLWRGLSEHGSQTHPPRAERLAAVQRGWQNGRGGSEGTAASGTKCSDTGLYRQIGNTCIFRSTPMRVVAATSRNGVQHSHLC